MISKKNAFIIALILGLGVFAIFINLLTYQIESNAFTIAVTDSQSAMFQNLDRLSNDLSTKVVLKKYANEFELMKAVYSGQVDAYSINLFRYIESYSKLPSGKAIVGIPTDYYLVASRKMVAMPDYVDKLAATEDSRGKITRPKIGIFESVISEQLLSGIRYSSITYSDSNERLKALNDSIIDYAIIREDYFDTTQYVVLKKLTDFGYTQDVFVLSREWIDNDIEDHLNIVTSIINAFTKTVTTPNEDEVIRAMTYLFNTERIQTRYYYKDLVYTLSAESNQ